MKQEIIIKIEEEIVTPHTFADMVANSGIPESKSFWTKFGNLDSIKCVLLSHGYSLNKGYTSVENQFVQFTVCK